MRVALLQLARYLAVRLFGVRGQVLRRVQGEVIQVNNYDLNYCIPPIRFKL